MKDGDNCIVWIIGFVVWAILWFGCMAIGERIKLSPFALLFLIVFSIIFIIVLVLLIFRCISFIKEKKDEKRKELVETIKKNFPYAFNKYCKENNLLFVEPNKIPKVLFNQLKNTSQSQWKQEEIQLRKEREERIKQYERNTRQYIFQYKREARQNNISNMCKSRYENVLQNWGAYKYHIPYYNLIDKEGNSIDGKELPVWHFFCTSSCSSQELDLSLFPDIDINTKLNNKLLNCTRFYKNQVYDKIFEFINNIYTFFSKYEDSPSLKVLFNDRGVDEDNQLFDCHFSYISNKLDENGISHQRINKNDITNLQFNKSTLFIVIDLTTTFETFESICTQLININGDLREIEDFDKCNASYVVYLSLNKVLSKDEMKQLISKKEKEIKEQKEEEKRRKIELERKQLELQEKTNIINEAKAIAESHPVEFKEFFPEIIIEDEDTAISVIKKKEVIEEWVNLRHTLSLWDTIKSIPFYFFWNYYPKRFDGNYFDGKIFIPSMESRSARELIYDFKDGRTPASKKVSQLVIDRLKASFSELILRELTLVCIPASTIDDTFFRYKNFSEKICESLGMKNAYSHIRITKEKTPAHLDSNHRSQPAEYDFDKAFFKNSKIVLFDDVVTTGRSMKEFTDLLENLGAKVICAISIGRTYSFYHGGGIKPHPYSGLM